MIHVQYKAIQKFYINLINCFQKKKKMLQILVYIFFLESYFK